MVTRKRVFYTTTVPKELISRIRAESDKTKVPQSRIVEQAVEDYLNKQTKEKAE